MCIRDRLGLDDVLANIEKAKKNENIKGIYLKGGTLIGGCLLYTSRCV